MVDEPALKERVAAAAGGGVLPLNHFTRQAPVLIVAVAEPASASARTGAAIKGKPFAMMDVAIAAEHLCLQAADEGLGTCLLGWFDEARVRTLLSIPASARPVLLITLGVADDAPSPRKRKALETISAWNRYPRAEAEAKEPDHAAQGWRAVMGWLWPYLAWIAFAAALAGAIWRLNPEWL